MTLQELIIKLTDLTDYRITNKNSEVKFFAEDDYNTIDVKINKVEVEEGKIYLS